MKTKYQLILVLLVYAFCAKAQPATDIILFDLTSTTDEFSISNPVNISQHFGYDNQPFFIPNKDQILYSSQRGDQTDVYRYDIANGTSIAVTSTPGGEYSPTITPDKKHFSCIILESSGRQLLWQYNADGSNPKVLVPDLKIGYHCWVNDQLIGAYVLGEPSTFQFCYLKEQRNEIITTNTGRSIHRIPGSSLVSFVDKSQARWIVKSYDYLTGQIDSLTTCLPGSEDMAWSSDGTLFMGQNSQLFSWDQTKKGEWKLVSDLSEFGFQKITRLAIDQDGNRIAIVVDDSVK